jgi:hypothetical protein
MSATQGQYVDHANGDTLNNTRENLRIATASQNAANSETGPLCGVYQYKNRTKPWYAYVYKNGKRFASYFHTKDEALGWRKSKHLELFGKWSFLARDGEQ